MAMLIQNVVPQLNKNEILYQEDKIPAQNFYNIESEGEDKTGKAVKPAVKKMDCDLKDSYDVSWSDSYGSSHDPFLEMDQ